MRKVFLSVFLVALSGAAPGGVASSEPAVASAATRWEPAATEPSPRDEIVYFVLLDRFENGDPANDRGGIDGTRFQHGFDPTSADFYLGGDLRGLTERLDYIQGLGATAIRLGPVYQNRAVQEPAGAEAAGYHGNWVTDFTRIDPHFGDDGDMRAFVEAAHTRGMKVYLDIIANHTADVIRYRECHDPGWTGERVYGACVYRSKAAYPLIRQVGSNGDANDTGFPYTPFIPDGEEAAKTPAWLNDIRYYNNRGDSTGEGESAIHGDLAGLDDLRTSDPRVLSGFIDIYTGWITRYRIDGVHITSASHMEPAFRQALAVALTEHARGLGIEHFHVLGGDADPAVPDTSFRSAVFDVLVDGQPTIRFEPLFGAKEMLAVSVSDPVSGRFAGRLNAADPGMRDEERLARVRLAHALMMFTGGVPVLYFGDEQGFVSDGGGRHAHEPLFASHVAEYNDNALIATTATTADSNFDTTHPLYTAIAGMADLYQAHAPLRRGEQVVRLMESDGGIFAFSRLDEDHSEYVIVMNMRPQGRRVTVDIDPRTTALFTLVGPCPAAVSAGGVAQFTVPGLDYVICRSNVWTTDE